MAQKTFCRLAGLVFLIIAVLHFLRVFYGWPVTVGANAIVVPMWVSYLIVVGTGFLSWQGFKNSKQSSSTVQ